MSINWPSFKSYLDCFNITATYFDNEGSEIPIETKCEFDEALKVAKSSNERLRMTLYFNNSKLDDAWKQKQRERSDVVQKLIENLIKKMMLSIQVPGENKNLCNKDAPEWFTYYMKKFKKELTHEIKSNFCEIIHSEGEKERKQKLKEDDIDLPLGKAEAITTSVTAHGKKKKKGWEKDLDLLDQREVKYVKKIEKLHPTKFDRLDKLDSKTRMLLEDRRRLIERKRHLKPSKSTANQEIGTKKESQKKSASFCKNEMCIFLRPNAEFAVNLNFTNNGLLRWEAPWLECFDFNGLYPEENKICLPRLLPMENGCTTLRGKVCESSGLHHFKCRLFDGLEHIGPDFTCWARVREDEPFKSMPNDAAVNSKDFDKTTCENSESLLMNFENYELSATRKKIKENISEIERRLRDIDLLRPTAFAEAYIKKHMPEQIKKELSNDGGDLFQNLEKAKEKLQQEDLNYKLDRLHVSESSKVKKNKKKDENTRAGTLDNSSDCENNSDSESSVIFVSEEDENFIVVPFPSKSPSLAESADEDKKFSRTGSEESNDAFVEGVELTVQDALDAFSEGKISAKVFEATYLKENLRRQFGSVKNRPPPLGEDVLKLKSKKIKPSLTEYNFTAANLTQPIFTQVPERFEEVPSKFTFSGEKNEKTPQNNAFEGGRSRVTPKVKKEENSQNEEDSKRRKIATTDASGKTIYAIHSNGRCFPVKDILQVEDRWQVPGLNEDFRKKPTEDNFQGDDQFDEIPTVNALPSVLMNTASNVASIALNTAKSVIINWHTAFANEGKPELGELD